jgi:hypothetical protein
MRTDVALQQRTCLAFNEWRRLRAKLLKLDEIVKNRNGLLMTGHEHTGKNGMSRSPLLGAVAAVGLASNDGRSQHALRQVIGRLEIVDVEETQEVRTVLAQASGKASIVGIGEALRGSDQGIQAIFQILSTLGEEGGGEGGFLSLQGQGGLQESGGLASKVQSSSRLTFLHLLQVGQQVAQAFLFEPVGQFAVIVGCETIGGEDPGEVRAQDVEDHITAAVDPDGVDGQVAMGKDPQPGSQRSDPPTGLIGVDHTALADRLQQLFVDGSCGASQRLVGLTPAAAADLQSKGIVEHFTDLAVGHPQAMLQIGGQRPGAWSDHHPRCPRRLRGLLRMARAYSPVASTAVAAVGHKMGGLHFHHRNIGHRLRRAHVDGSLSVPPHTPGSLPASLLCFR